MNSPKTIVGLGEILWDLLPGGKQLGGAPANFAHHAAQLGDDGLPASRVGTDPLGEEIIQRLETLGLSTEFIQRDSDRATGTVNVTVGEDGQPSYEIVENVAWDRLEWSPEWLALAARCDAVCFGSLAQRNEVSKRTIAQFLERAGSRALTIFDINLRQHYHDPETLEKGLRLSRVAKMNDEELPRITTAMGITFKDEETAARELLRRFELEMVCVTRGAKGSLLVEKSGGRSVHPGHVVQVADTVGSGDAFVAALAYHVLRGSTLEKINAAANRLGAFVATQRGATPMLTNSILREIIA